MSSWKDRFANMMKQPEEDENMDDFEGYYDEEEPAEPAQEAAPAPEQPQQNNDQGGQADNANSGGEAAPADDGKIHLMLFKPETFDKDVTTMADKFIEGDTLILNMEQTNKDVAKRIIDFLGGVAYAHSGNIRRVAEDTYIVMPSNIDLTGDEFVDEVESDNVYF